MDIGSELFSMGFALKLQRVAHPTAEASSLRLSDASTADNSFYLGSDNIKVIFFLSYIYLPKLFMLWLAFCFHFWHFFPYFYCNRKEDGRKYIINRPKRAFFTTSSTTCLYRGFDAVFFFFVLFFYFVTFIG